MIRRRPTVTTPLDRFVADFAEDAGYLDFARLGPVSERVVAEERMMGEFSARARFGSLELGDEQDERVRDAVAGQIGFAPEQVVFQPDTSTGLMHTMFGLDGTVALSPDEHPSLRAAVVRAGQALGHLEAAWLESEYGRILPGTLRDQLTPEVTAVAVSFVDHRTGYRADLEGIRQVIGDRLLIVDAVQGFGVVDAPWEVADVIACGGQKWVRAGRSTGFLAMSDRAVERLEPVLSGWRGEPVPVDPDVELPGGVPDPVRGVAAFSISRPRPAAQARLAAALEGIAAVGIDEIERAVEEKVDRALSIVDEFGLQVSSPRNPSERAGMVVIEPDGDQLTQLAAAFYNHGVTVTSRNGGIRLSMHVSTSDETFTLLRTAIAEFAAATPA